LDLKENLNLLFSQYYYYFIVSELEKEFHSCLIFFYAQHWLFLVFMQLVFFIFI